MKEIKLTQDKYAIVDDDDYDILKDFSWFALRSKQRFYVCCKMNGKLIRMHRFLLKPPDDLMVDHKNLNGLDNRRSNLRICSNSENMRNQRIRKDNLCGYKGVERCGSTFRASVTVNGIKFRSSMFKTAIEAAKYYDDIAIKLYGEFAKTNIMLGLI